MLNNEDFDDLGDDSDRNGDGDEGGPSLFVVRPEEQPFEYSTLIFMQSLGYKAAIRE